MSLPWPDWTTAEWEEKLKEPRAAGGTGSGNFGHAGRPGEVGGSSTDATATVDLDRLTNGVSPELATGIKIQADKLMTASFSDPKNIRESLVWIDAKTGEQVLGTAPIMGDLSGVDVTDYQQTSLHAMPAQSVISIHTHPSSSPFSQMDFDSTVAFQQKGAIVLGRDGTTYELQLKRQPGVFEVPSLRDDLRGEIENTRRVALQMADNYAIETLHVPAESITKFGRATIARQHPGLEEWHNKNWDHLATQMWQRFADDHANIVQFRVNPPKGQS